MEKYGYIYKFTFLPKNLIYIGKRKATVFDENYYGSGVMWKRIISDCNKETDITREILEWCETREDLNQAEIKWIEYYNAIDHSIGCNVSLGGDGGNFTEETLQKISNTMKTRGSQKGENNGALRYNSPDRNGENNPAYGRHWYNNGEINIFDYDCPEGFTKGMLRKKVIK